MNEKAEMKEAGFLAGEAGGSMFDLFQVDRRKPLIDLDSQQRALLFLRQPYPTVGMRRGEEGGFFSCKVSASHLFLRLLSG